ncbi:UPF0462 protein C4orf33 homolog [Ptychodera flava]|uniref:UPF0462 protein C4orf33 homolog n=1 Tax=Ptychodera flava TaxID=63121 RepID=UPI003969C2F2
MKIKCNTMETLTFQIKTQWNSIPIDHQPVVIRLSRNHDNNHINLEVDSPFFNDPAAPVGQVGKPFQQLWDYEGMPVHFIYSCGSVFSSRDNKYLEVELCPHGQHLVLALNGFRKVMTDELPLDFKATISGNTWHGSAEIPMEYFPPNTRKFNAYAIHGSADKRIYEALYPAPHDKHSQPDFHRLEYFQAVEFKDMIKATHSELWTSTN